MEQKSIFAFVVIDVPANVTTKSRTNKNNDRAAAAAAAKHANDDVVVVVRTCVLYIGKIDSIY